MTWYVIRHFKNNNNTQQRHTLYWWDLWTQYTNKNTADTNKLKFKSDDIIFYVHQTDSRIIWTGAKTTDLLIKELLPHIDNIRNLIEIAGAKTILPKMVETISHPEKQFQILRGEIRMNDWRGEPRLQKKLTEISFSPSWGRNSGQELLVVPDSSSNNKTKGVGGKSRHEKYQLT